jgi:hypothetical protein
VEGDSESGFSGIGAAMPGHPNGWGNDFYELLTALPLQNSLLPIFCKNIFKQSLPIFYPF